VTAYIGGVHGFSVCPQLVTGNRWRKRRSNAPGNTIARVIYRLVSGACRAVSRGDACWREPDLSDAAKSLTRPPRTERRDRITGGRVSESAQNGMGVRLHLRDRRALQTQVEHALQAGG
jgi:hypothetical protein